MDKNGGIPGYFFTIYGGAFLLFCIAIAVFAFFISRSKRKLGIISGIALLLLTIAWLFVAPGTIY